MSTDLSGIGLRLREIRRSNNLTQPVMAACIDVSDRTYKYYEQEKRELPAIAAVKISERFGVNLDWLLTGRGNVNKSDNPELEAASAVAVMKESEARKTGLSIEKLGNVIWFVAEQASQTGKSPAEIAQRYFDTL